MLIQRVNASEVSVCDMKASHAAKVAALTASFRERGADLTTDHKKAVDKLKKYG